MTVCLALIAAIRKKDLVTRTLVVATVVMILFSLGENLAILNRPMFDYFPLFDAFRVPETWLVIVSLIIYFHQYYPP